MKGAITIITDEAMATCRLCRSLMSPIIVPPTFYKDMSKVFLSIVWNKAEVAMREVDHIIFCGYSFPDADMHIKYLLKRIETNRDGKDLRVTIVCNHPGKSEMQKQEEKGRYSRFFGCKINYTDLSFEEFASQPQVFY